MPYRVLQVKLTNHAQKRLSKRLGIKTKEAAQRFARDVVKNGRIVSGQSSSIIIVRHGHSFVFVRGVVDYSGESILLMITACNDAKSSEWEWFHHGEVRKGKAVKKSKGYGGCYREKNIVYAVLNKNDAVNVS